MNAAHPFILFVKFFISMIIAIFLCSILSRRSFCFPVEMKRPWSSDYVSIQRNKVEKCWKKKKCSALNHFSSSPLLISQAFFLVISLTPRDKGKSRIQRNVCVHYSLWPHIDLCFIEMYSLNFFSLIPSSNGRPWSIQQIK